MGNNQHPHKSNNNRSNANESTRKIIKPKGIDLLDIKIIKEVLDNPDVSSPKIAKKLGVPLSTVQRRKTSLEHSVLKRKYELDVRDLGWRNAEVLMLVNNGKADHTAQELSRKFDQIIATSIRVNTKNNLALQVSFRNSDDFHELMEKIRAVPDITNLEWSEIVRESEDKAQRQMNLIFNSSE